jgi:hypothetical protein
MWTRRCAQENVFAFLYHQNKQQQAKIFRMSMINPPKRIRYSLKCNSLLLLCVYRMY